MRGRLIIPLAIGLAGFAHADERRASSNYTLHCQGCHLADARGLQDEVPRMKDFVGFYLHSQQGREFVIRVPGVATSSLSDDELAELMNWVLKTFSRQQLPANFVPFTATEVASLRANLETDPTNARIRILAEIASSVPALADELTTPIGR